MSCLRLPAPDATASTALLDTDKVRAWLAVQPQNQALRLLRALLAEIRGIDACIADPALRLEILDTLRPALLQASAAAEIRYAARPLPFLRDEALAFAAAWEPLFQLAVAYLRAVPLLPPSAMARPLHRAAIALREALRCHYLAAIEPDARLLPLLYDTLVTAEAMQVQRNLVSDPDLPHLGESTVAAEIAWSLLLRAIDPYRLSPAQLTVTHRALSRWRDLASFQAQAATEAKEVAIPLAKLIGQENLVSDGPAWMEVRAVRRKLRKRIEALNQGETPDQLKLGRELSSSACLQLLEELNQALRAKENNNAGKYLTPEAASLDLVFGFDKLYTLLSGKHLGETELSLKSGRNSHERIAVFGFDNVANRVDHAGDQRIPAETWAVEDDWVLRAAPAGAQMLSATLLGIRSESPVFAILCSLRQTVDGWLAGHLRALPSIQGSGLLQAAPLATTRQAVFFLAPEEPGKLPSILIPTGIGMREGSALALDESPVEHLRLGELLERGGNFLRFAYTRG